MAHTGFAIHRALQAQVNPNPARKLQFRRNLVAQTVGSSNTKWDSNTLFAWLHEVAALGRVTATSRGADASATK